MKLYSFHHHIDSVMNAALAIRHILDEMDIYTVHATDEARQIYEKDGLTAPKFASDGLLMLEGKKISKKELQTTLKVLSMLEETHTYAISATEIK